MIWGVWDLGEAWGRNLNGIFYEVDESFVVAVVELGIVPEFSELLFGGFFLPETMKTGEAFGELDPAFVFGELLGVGALLCL